MKKIAISLTLLFTFLGVFAQQNLNVLFIGNSYTAASNLPSIITDMAESTGNELTYQSNNPGGTTFSGHCSNNSISMIYQGGWDYVVLQGQSQETAFPDSQVETETFPFAEQLCEEVYNNCAMPVFFMSWGYKNGDLQNGTVFPPIGTYEGMDSLIHLRYMMMAEANNAQVSPCGRVWHYIRDNHPEIELYSSDNSHPSYAGSYAAACSFYATLFRQDPTLITFNGTLSEQEANTIKAAAKVVVFDNLEEWFIGEYDADLDFSAEPCFAVKSTESSVMSFINTSYTYWDVEEITWDFGDGNTSNEIEAIHEYENAGEYTVTMTLTDECGNQFTHIKTIEAVATGSGNISDFNNEWVNIYPNPVEDILTISLSDELNATDLIFTITDQTGREIKRWNNTSNTITVDASSLVSGVFFVSAIKNNTIIHTFKCIKK